MTTEEPVSPRIRRYKRNILIYPAQKNYATEQPFRRLHKYFEEVLSYHDLCLVIGFSFRDPSINNTFLDFLIANPKRKLIAVSPTASVDVPSNLIRYEPRLEELVAPLNMSFGQDTTFEAIKVALSETRAL